VNNLKTVRNLEDLEGINDVWVKAICPKCGMIVTSLIPNAKQVVEKGCVACTLETEDEWTPYVRMMLVKK